MEIAKKTWSYSRGSIGSFAWETRIWLTPAPERRRLVQISVRMQHAAMTVRIISKLEALYLGAMYMMPLRVPSDQGKSERSLGSQAPSSARYRKVEL